MDQMRHCYKESSLAPRDINPQEWLKFRVKRRGQKGKSREDIEEGDRWQKDTFSLECHLLCSDEKHCCCHLDDSRRVSSLLALRRCKDVLDMSEKKERRIRPTVELCSFLWFHAALV
jgi:hypothetical protein